MVAYSLLQHSFGADMKENAFYFFPYHSLEFLDGPQTQHNLLSLTCGT